MAITGVDQAHKQITGFGAVQSAIEESVLAIQRRALQCTFADIVIQRRTRLTQECRKSFPVTQQRDGFAQTRVRLHLLHCELPFQPIVQLLHQRSAMLLMKSEAFDGRELSQARLRIICIHFAQCLQNITAWFRKVRGDFHKLSSSVGQTVGRQDLRTVSQFRRVTRQRIAHLKRPGELDCAVLEHIAQIFAGLLAAGEVPGDWSEPLS